MTTVMKPRMPAVAREVWQAVPSRLAQWFATMGAPLRPRSRRRIPPQPFHDAALVCPLLRVGARQPVVVLGSNARPFLEKRAPVFGVPFRDFRLVIFFG